MTYDTLFILGAGASHPYGMPLGRELRDKVVRVSQEVELLSRLSGLSAAEHDFEAFARDLAESGFPSIDTYLEQRERQTSVGKAAISLCLLRDERKALTKLFPPGQPRDHWYEALWNSLKRPTWNEFASQSWGAITFNYDRTLEHYLVRVACNNYDVAPKTALKHLPIHHMHGSLGEYDPATFGEFPNANNVNLAAKAIRVIHESDKHHPVLKSFQHKVREARRVLFIGFGYHDANMEKLGAFSERSLTNKQLIIGTHKGFKARAWESICTKHNFSLSALKTGAGSITDFIRTWLK